MKLKHLIIIFTLFDDKVQPYLSSFNVYPTGDIKLLGIGFKCNSLEWEEEEEEEDQGIAYPILLIKDDNYSYQVYDDKIRKQIGYHQNFLLVLHSSSQYKYLQREAILGNQQDKLIHPIREEHHDSGSVFDFISNLSTIGDETQFYAKIENYVSSFQLNTNKEAKLYLLNTINRPKDAQNLLNGVFQNCLVVQEVENILKNQELKQKLSVFASQQISFLDFRNDLIKILEG